MNKQEMKDRIYQIQAMGRIELADFLKKVELSLLSPKDKTYLLRAVEVRMGELDPASALVESGELTASEARI
jgi:hypothetical protein